MAIMCLFAFRYIESMVHFASIRHPAAILDDLHGKVLNEAYQISKSTVTESVSLTTQRLGRQIQHNARVLIHRRKCFNVQILEKLP